MAGARTRYSVLIGGEVQMDRGWTCLLFVGCGATRRAAFPYLVVWGQCRLGKLLRAVDVGVGCAYCTAWCARCVVLEGVTSTLPSPLVNFCCTQKKKVELLRPPCTSFSNLA